jgi:hypothetical protein
MILDAEGGFGKVYGVDMPGRGGLPRIEGTSPEEHQQYIDRARQLYTQHPELGVKGAAQEAHLQLYNEQQNKGQQSTSSGAPLRALNTFGNAAISGVNRGLEGVNAVSDLVQLLSGGEGGKAQIPLIQHTAPTSAPAMAELFDGGQQSSNIGDVTPQDWQPRPNPLRAMMMMPTQMAIHNTPDEAPMSHAQALAMYRTKRK